MATNHFFQHGLGIGDKSEQNLYQELVNEIIQIAGADFTYIPRELVSLDELYREDTLARFSRNFNIEMYIENYEQFLGNGAEISKFGFQLGDELRLIVSRERFMTVVEKALPVEGDLIFYPTSRSLFEIKYVDDKAPLFPLGSRQYFVITCRVFTYSNEEMNTGTEADEVQTQFSNDGTTINDPFAKNTEIETKADEILDFTEANPFGEA